MSQTTLAKLIERLCKTVLNDWKSGTATGGSASTLIDTVNRDEEDDYFQNTTPVSYAYILTTTDNSAPKGEERKSSDFVNSTATLSVAPDFSAAVGAGDTYTIIHLKRWEELKEYVNMAIDLVKEECLAPAINETDVIIQSDVYEYPLPSEFTHIYRITQADSDGEFNGYPINPDHYTIIRAANTPILHFKQPPPELAVSEHYYGALWYDSEATDGRRLRIEGFKEHPSLVEDTDMCHINPNFVVAQAGALVHASLVRRADNEPDDHASQNKVWQNIANSIRGSRGFITRFPPNTKRVK